jgi:pimeloyl-ACP methyl ester carboxylesterase
VRSAVRGVIGITVVAAAIAGARPEPAATRTPSCAAPRATSAHTNKVQRALRTHHDLWGNQLLSAPDGPSYAAAQRLLPPLFYARAPGKRPLTESGAYYLPFGQPLGARGAGSIALHVADGSQVIAERVGGRRLTVSVGAKGRERYGACVSRLGFARLADGYLPILATSYTDGAGVRYRQESFAAQTSETGSLVSFVRLDADATHASMKAARLRVTTSVRRLRSVLAFSPGGTAKGPAVTYRIRRGTKRTVYLAWINYPGRRGIRVDAARYETARRAVGAYWRKRLTEGTQIVVPERRVNDAYRNLLVQNLLLTWRYSIGNPYEQFSFPEGVDVAEVMGELGYAAVSRSVLRTSLTRKDTPYPNWKMGKRLVGSALHYRLTRDRAYVDAATPTLRRYVDDLGSQITGGATGLLGRERYSSDIPDEVLGLHSQATVWQGLRAMGRVWAETGQAELARRCDALATRLETALRKAVASSQRRLADGSLFLPARLLDDERAYESLTQAKLGSYWNLVMPYALGSGLFEPGSPEATGALRYLLRHGSRLLGVVRAGAYALYEKPVYPVSGTDQVYGINAARFLADNDAADQLVLSLYGSLAVAMTPGTFVSGEAASVTPRAGEHFRSMYLPPNGASNAAFLETLRSLVVHETRDAEGTPVGLELAFSTPRPWLRAGRKITVRKAPTSFGPVSYTLEARSETILATVDAPSRPSPKMLALRIRLPRGQRVESATVNGRPLAPPDGGTLGETLDLTGQGSHLEVVVRYGSRRPTSSAGLTSVKRLRVQYIAHDGKPNTAWVVLPAWYGPAANPALPLIISPHGRGLNGRTNSILWGNLPGRGSFAVINPDARGRRLPGHSWGYTGQVDDLARMPEILRTTLPWLRVDRRRIYAFGGSMGGQETLLLLARHPKLLAGAAAFSSVTDMGLQYRNWDRLVCSNKCRTLLGKARLGSSLRRLARIEIGGGPGQRPQAYASRSPITYERSLAHSCVPLQIWWSVADRIVVDQQSQSGRLFWDLRRLNPQANVEAFVGFWIHSAEMRARTGLPLALSRFGLLQAGKAWESIRRVKPIGTPCTREGATEQEPEPAP